MPARTRRIPSYRLHRPTGQAVVRLDGRDHYLGRHGTEASREAYRRKVAEWLAGAPPAPTSAARAAPDDQGPTIGELILAYWAQAEVEYRRPDGSPGSELEKIRLALRPLRGLYGGTPARAFGPLALKALRQSLVESGLCRRTINQRVARVVRLFRFGVENELLPADVHHALKAVPGLRRGRSGAKEGRVVGPVADDRVDAVLPHLPRQLRAVVELQRLTGMRSGEALAMRTGDLDTADEVWVYTPARHKTAYRGRARAVPLGPRAQEVLRPWLRSDPAEYLFQPREAQEEYRAARRRARKTPLTPSQRARRRKPGPKKSPGVCYDPRAYGRAVARACDRAFPHPALSTLPAKELTADQLRDLAAWRREHRWHPHQLRHGAATRLRREFGLDIARAVLGHASPAVTETYALVDASKAAEAMRLRG